MAAFLKISDSGKYLEKKGEQEEGKYFNNNQFEQKFFTSSLASPLTFNILDFIILTTTK